MLNENIRLSDNRIYGIWEGMKARCYNPNNGSYEDAQIFRTEQGYYLDILFLCNNEFSINLLTPARLLPEISAEVSNRR